MSDAQLPGRFAKPAEKQFRRLPRAFQAAALDELAAICAEPPGERSKPFLSLDGARIVRIRHDARMIYVVLPNLVLVLAIGWRGDVYKSADRIKAILRNHQP